MPAIIEPKSKSPAVMMTRQEIAGILKVSPNTILNLVERGEFPRPIRVGRQFRWSTESVRDWIEK